jgi:putative transposase
LRLVGRTQNIHEDTYPQKKNFMNITGRTTIVVIRYIRNQEEHHKKMDFDSEFVALLKKHGIEFDPKFVFG